MKIPVADAPTVGATTFSGGNFSPSQVADAGAGLRDAGNAASRLSAQTADFVTKMAEETNSLIADDALAQIKDYSIDLRLNPETGFLSLKGRNALDRPDGKNLLTEYNEYLNNKNEEILKTLKNDRQRELYQAGLVGIRQTFEQQIQTHLLQENRNYHAQASKSGIEMASRSFALAASDEERDAALSRIETNLMRLQGIEGWDNNTLLSKAIDVSDGAVRLAVGDLLDSERYDEASKLLAKYKDYARPETILRAKEQINDAWQSSVVDAAVSNIGQDGIVRITLPSGGSVDGANPISDTVNRIIGHESGNNPKAKNKNSSAEGLGQFINSTWLNMVKTHRPDIAAGKSNAQIIAMKTDAKLSREMTERYVQHNSQRLKAAGFPVNVRNLYLMHFAGESKGIQILRSDPSAPISSVLSKDAMAANGFLKGKTVQQTLDWAARAMGVNKDTGSGMVTYTINTNDPVQMERDLKRLPKSMQAKTRTGINHQLSAIKQAEQERIAQRDNVIMKMIEQAGGNVSGVRKSLWTSLTPDERHKFTNFAQSLRTNNQQELFENNKAVYYDLILNPDKMSSMSETQIQAYGQLIGFDRASQLVEAKRKHEAAKTKGVDSPVKVETSVINSIADIYKIKRGAKANDEQIQQYYDLAENVRLLAKNMALSLGRQPTESELIEAARKMQADKVITEKGFFGLFDKEKPALLLGREDREKADKLKGSE